MESKEVERLKYELGRRDKAIRDRDRQLVQLRCGADEAAAIFNAYMIKTALKYGYRHETEAGVFEHCISVPKVDLNELSGLVLRLVGQDEDGDNILAVVEKEQEEAK